MSDELIRIPAFLAEETGDYGIMPMCDFCAEVACETADMECGQACGQSCGSQCTVSECKQSCSQGCSQCGSCESSSQTVYTAPTFTITNITETGADINVSPGTGYTRYRVFARLTSDPDDVSYDWTFSETTAFTAEMDSLEPKTEYTVNVCGVIGNTSDKWAGAKTFTTGAKNRPGYFSWLRGFVTSKPVANELPRGGDIPPYLTADGWNTYTANINAVREYRGLGQYSFTTARRGVTRLSADMVNEAIAAISAMSPPTSPPGRATPMVTPGSASLLNKLVDSLNSIS